MADVLDRLPRPSARAMRGLAFASLFSQVAIVVTGGAVRLTGSGLGCPTWPRCTEDSFTPTAEYGVHGVIEFGNRLLTYVLVAIALATLVAAFRHQPRRPDLRRLSLVLFLGIPVQAVIGGITVLTALNPWTVAGHFLVSMVLVGIATLLVRRTAAPGLRRPRLGVHPLLRRLGLAQVGVLAVVLVLGTVVTGSGPHAGDREVPRTGLDPELVSRLHADTAFLLVGMTVATLVALVVTRAPASVRRATAVLLSGELAQGALGYLQYFTGLPVLLVGLHMLGAALLVVAAVRAADTMVDRSAAAGPRLRGGRASGVPRARQVSTT